MRGLIAFSSVFVAILPVAADHPSEAEKNDIKLLQGTWQKVNTSNKDPDAPPKGPEEAHRALMAMISKRYDGQKEISMWDGGEEKQYSMIYKLDPTKSPKHMDRFVTEDGSTDVHKMIYEIDGDSLRLGFFKGYSSRPKSFDDVGIYTSTWRRVNRPKLNTALPNSSREPNMTDLGTGLQQLQGVWQRVGSAIVLEPVGLKLQPEFERSLVARMGVRFEENRFRILFDGKDRSGVIITVSVDITKIPKQMDRIFEYDGKKEVQRSIYEIVDDKLRIGELKNSSVRPESFDQKDILILTYQKSKK